MSSLLSQDKLRKSLLRYGEDYITNVFVRYSKPVGISKAVASKSPTFHDVTNFYGEGGTLYWLRFHIAETFAFLGIYDTATVYQIRATAEMIMSHEIFGQLTLDEFLCFLQRFKQGRYGKIFQSARPNPQEFLMCLEPFWSELSKEREKLSEQERRQRIADDINSEPSITYEQWLREKQASGEKPLSDNNPLKQIFNNG